MKAIWQIKQEREEKQTALFNETGVFFAFSDKQFEEGKAKHPIAEGEKYSRLPHGGFLPSKNAKKLLDGLEALNKWYKSEVNESKETRRALIAYELANHEAYYTGSINDTFDALGEGFTRQEIAKVYNEERTKINA